MVAAEACIRGTLYPLFLMVLDVLGLLIGRAAQVGMFEGFAIGNGDLAVSHLQFADGTMIFCDNSQW